MSACGGSKLNDRKMDNYARQQYEYEKKTLLLIICFCQLLFPFRPSKNKHDEKKELIYMMCIYAE